MPVLLGDNIINTIWEITESLLHVSKEAVLKVNTEKTKYIFISHHKNKIIK